MSGVWDYGSADDIKPLTDSSDDENSDHGTRDQLSLLPANKRRKLEKLHQGRKKVDLIDLDNEDDDAQDKGLQDFYTSSKPAVKPIANSESDSDLEYRPTIKRAPMSTIPLDPVILQNQALLRSFREAAQQPEEDEQLPEPAPYTKPRQPIAAPQPQEDYRGSNSEAGSDEEEASPEPAPADDGKVVISLQSAKGKLQLRIGQQTALSKLFDLYKQQATKKGWLSDDKLSSVRFWFDGDRLSGTETASGLDLDNNDIIEVKW